MKRVRTTLMTVLSLSLLYCGGAAPPAPETPPVKVPETPPVKVPDMMPPAAVPLVGDWTGKKPASGTLSEITITLSLASGGGLTYAAEYQYEAGAKFFGGCKSRREVGGKWVDASGKLQLTATKGTSQRSECENDSDNQMSDYTADELATFGSESSGPYKIDKDTLTIEDSKLPVLTRK